MLKSKNGISTGNTTANTVASTGQRCVANGSRENSPSYLVPLRTNTVPVFRMTDVRESARVCSAYGRLLCPYLCSGFPVTWLLSTHMSTTLAPGALSTCCFRSKSGKKLLYNSSLQFRPQINLSQKAPKSATKRRILSGGTSLLIGTGLVNSLTPLTGPPCWIQMMLIAAGQTGLTNYFRSCMNESLWYHPIQKKSPLAYQEINPSHPKKEHPLAKATSDYTAYKHYINKVVRYLRNVKLAYFRKLNPRQKNFGKPVNF